MVVLIFCPSDFEWLRATFVLNLLRGLQALLPEPEKERVVMEEYATYRGKFYIQLTMKIERR